MRKQKKYHYIYKITRFDGKYYIGLHSTNNLDDGYFGSGTRLRRSIRKYGQEKHSKEIIEFLPTREELKAREKELVNEECVTDPMCMNIALGGGSGWDHINHGSMKHFNKRYQDGYNASISPFSNPERYTSEQLEEINEKRKEGGKKGYENAKEKLEYHKLLVSLGIKENGFKGKHHNEETKKRISTKIKEIQSGEKNNNFGKIWVHSLSEQKSKMIKKEELDYWINLGWIKGAKYKW